MLARSVILAAPVFCRIVDASRQHEPFARSGVLYPIRIELGEGVTTCTPYDLQCKIDAMMQRSQKFASVKLGRVFNRNNSEAKEIVAYRQYVVTGNMRGGYVKGDPRYGPRMTGCAGATMKPGLKWNGDDL